MMRITSIFFSLFLISFLGIAFAQHSWATVYHSDGSDANV